MAYAGFFVKMTACIVQHSKTPCFHLAPNSMIIFPSKFYILSTFLSIAIPVFAQSHFTFPYQVYSYDLVNTMGSNSDAAKQVAAAYNSIVNDSGSRCSINFQWTNGVANPTLTRGMDKQIILDFSGSARGGVNFVVLDVSATVTNGQSQNLKTTFVPRIIDLGGGLAKIEVQYSIPVKGKDGNITHLKGTLLVGNVSRAELNQLMKPVDVDQNIPIIKVSWTTRNSSIPLYTTSWTSSYESWNGTTLTIHNITITAKQKSTYDRGPRNERMV